jgi:error-prone DNA polymerase
MPPKGSWRHAATDPILPSRICARAGVCRCTRSSGSPSPTRSDRSGSTGVPRCGTRGRFKQAPDLPLFAYAEERDEGDRSSPARLRRMPLSEHVVNDYQTVRLSLKAHPMHFLRAPYGAQGFVTAEQLKAVRDGKRLSIAGVVLIRQRPGTSKGVVFITIEDETGVANLVIWPDLFERQRKVVMGARLMAVHGIVQRDEDGGVIHVVARRLEDHTHMLQHLSDDSLPNSIEKRESVGSWGRPHSRHPRDVQIIPKSRDFH